MMLKSEYPDIDDMRSSMYILFPALKTIALFISRALLVSDFL